MGLLSGPGEPNPGPRIPSDDSVLAAAAENNRRGGRPRKVDDVTAEKVRELKAKGINATDIGKMLGISRATVYRYLAA